MRNRRKHSNVPRNRSLSCNHPNVSLGASPCRSGRGSLFFPKETVLSRSNANVALKKVVPNLAPFFVKLFNKSLGDRVFPQSFKTPILKTNLDSGDASSYRLSSNLALISKLLERLILVKITKHLDNNKLLPVSQSAYRQYHSIEKVVLKVFSDVLGAADHGQLLALLD